MCDPYGRVEGGKMKRGTVNYMMGFNDFRTMQRRAANRYLVKAFSLAVMVFVAGIALGFLLKG